MLVYMFRRNGDHALTRDVTGRNLPCRTAANPWVFLREGRTSKTRPPLSAEALCHLNRVGYCIL
jgi:hypothetical protein